MKKIFAILAAGIVLCGCQKDFTEDVNPQISRETPVNLTKEGILKFESQSAFDQCMNEIIQNPTNGIAIVDRYVGKSEGTRSNSDRIFNSIARIRADRETRVGNLDIIYDDNIVPEMTEEEFRDYIIDELLVDERLEYVLDSDLRIVVADTVYQITTDGVFIMSYDNITLMEEIIETYHTDVVLNGNFEYLTYIGEGRYFYRDVQIIPNPDNDIVGPVIPVDPVIPADPTDPTNPENPADPEEPVVDSIIDEDVNRFLSYYADCENVQEYALRAPIIALNSPLEEIPTNPYSDFGAGYNEFNETVRMKAKFYKFDMGIYKSFGFNVKLQKKKSFLGSHYWVRMKSDGINIIIKKLNVDLKCDYTGKQGTPYGSDSLMSVSSYINRFPATYTVRMLRHKIIPISPLKDNKDIIAGTIGSFEDTPAIQAMFNASDNQIYTLIHQIDGLTIGSPHNRTVTTDDVRTVMICYGGSDFVRNYVSGVLSYPNTENNNIPKRVGFKIFDSFGVQFASAWNFRINNNIDETIRYADVGATVKYKNKWLGCRFYIEEQN